MVRIKSNLFWYNYVSSILSRHTECLSVFCSSVLYHLEDLSENYDKVFEDSLVKDSLYHLTLSVYSLNRNAAKEDVINCIRLVLVDLLDNYTAFEKYLTKQIPDVTNEEILFSEIVAQNNCLNDDEHIEFIRKELDNLKIQFLTKD